TASQTGNSNYTAAPEVTQQLTVNKKALTITAHNKTMKQGEPLPTFTVGYDGFVEGEDESVMTSMPVFNTIATSASVPGNYNIEISGAAANNYSISYNSGILTIEEETLSV